jgi:hypothetical protein
MCADGRPGRLQLVRNLQMQERGALLGVLGYADVLYVATRKAGRVENSIQCMF